MSLKSDHSSDAAAIAVADSVGLSGNELAIAMLEQSQDCIKILSIDGHLEFMNCNGLAAMEIDRSELVIGKLWWELWPEPSQGFVRDKFRKAANGQEIGFKAECPTAKGSPRRWVVNMRPLFAPDGPVVSILAVSRDTTGDNRDSRWN